MVKKKFYLLGLVLSWAVFLWIVKQFSSVNSKIKVAAQNTDKEYQKSKVPLVKDLYKSSWSVNASHVCTEKRGPLVLTIVISAPDHVDQRNAIRGSWGQEIRWHEEMALIFMLGKVSDMSDIQREAEMHKDMVVSDNEDNYENLSLKTLSAFSWTRRFCPEASYLLKVDDDVFIQPARVYAMFKGLKRASQISLQSNPALILGNVATGWKPSRNQESKYYIAPEQYPDVQYPPFATGPSYALSVEAVDSLLSIVWNHPYISLEDVFFTGILAEQANIPRRLVPDFRNNAVRIPAKFLGCTLLRTISIHQVEPHEHPELSEMSKRPDCSPSKPLSQKRLKAIKSSIK